MQGIVIVLLLACSLPSVPHAVQHRPGNTVTLCEKNLQQDKASEILLPIFDKFEDWARAYCLTESTIEKLESQDVNSSMVVKLLDKSDVRALGLTTGQQRVLMLLVKKLKEAEAREAALARAREAALARAREAALAREREDAREMRTYNSYHGRQQEGDGVGKFIAGTAVGTVVGLGSIVAAPALLTAAGFTSAGVALGSIGASVMSTAAISNGGSIAAGSVVSALQSFGAAGIPTAVQGVVTVGGAILGGLAGIIG